MLLRDSTDLLHAVLHAVLYAMVAGQSHPAIRISEQRKPCLMLRRDPLETAGPGGRSRAPCRSIRVGAMDASKRTSGFRYRVDEPLLRTIAAGIQAAISGAEMRLVGSRARDTGRPDSDIDQLVTVPDTWLAMHSCFESTARSATGWPITGSRSI